MIRLEVEDKMDKRLLKMLEKEFDIDEDDLFRIPGPLDLTFLMKMYGLDGFDEYKIPKYIPAAVPALMNEDDIFTNIRKGDILLHHPYMTFDPVVQFVQQAAKDPDVLAIKQTLYRVSGQFSDYCSTGSGGGKWQTGFRTGGIKGTVRRRKQYCLGEDAGKGGMPCDLWSSGTENTQ